MPSRIERTASRARVPKSSGSPTSPAPADAAAASPARPSDRFVAEAAAPPAGQLPPGPQPALRQPARTAASLPWSATQQRPPRDLVLPWDLRSPAAREDKLLRLTDGKGGLFAVGEWKPGARPLVLVHGINADFADLQPIVERFRDCPDRQLLVFAYDDKGRYTEDNALDLADELARLRHAYPWTGQLDIVAHSMGGIIARRALNEMTSGRDPGRIDIFDRVRFVAVDTPWHGFPGPGFRLPFFKGAMDMQAKSGLFQGDGRGNSVADRAGLAGVDLPGHVEVQLIAADNAAAGQKQDGILGPTELGRRGGANLSALRSAVTEMLLTGRLQKPQRGGDERVYAYNFLGALVQDADWPQAERELRPLVAQGKLDDAALAAALNRVMPRYAGGHSDVLANPALLRDLEARLR